MPIHDWTRVSAGTWHAFHLSWISEIQLALNGGLLPTGYYAQVGQIAAAPTPADLPVRETAGPAVEMAPPQTRYTAVAEKDAYVSQQRVLVVRHANEDLSVTALELVCPGNKTTRRAIRTFVDTAVRAIYGGLHLLVIDLFPPTPRDPRGIHDAIWSEITENPVEFSPTEPLTLAAYSAGPITRYYVEPTAVGRELIDMPLFLEPEEYINVPLEATYMAAYRGVPRKWQQVLG